MCITLADVLCGAHIKLNAKPVIINRGYESGSQAHLCGSQQSYNKTQVLRNKIILPQNQTCLFNLC